MAPGEAQARTTGSQFCLFPKVSPNGGQPSSEPSDDNTLKGGSTMNRDTKIGLTVAAGGVAAAGLVFAVAFGADYANPQPQPGAPQPSVAEADVQSSTPKAIEPVASEFIVDLKTKSKQCFGSAGCNVTVEPDITYTGAPESLDGVLCDITYKLSGDESGDVIETAEVDGDSLTFYPSSLSTPSSSVDVEAEVTDVSCY